MFVGWSLQLLVVQLSNLTLSNTEYIWSVVNCRKQLCLKIHHYPWYLLTTIIEMSKLKSNQTKKEKWGKNTLMLKYLFFSLAQKITRYLFNTTVPILIMQCQFFRNLVCLSQKYHKLWDATIISYPHAHMRSTLHKKYHRYSPNLYITWKGGPVF